MKRRWKVKRGRFVVHYPVSLFKVIRNYIIARRMVNKLANVQHCNICRFSAHRQFTNPDRSFSYAIICRRHAPKVVDSNVCGTKHGHIDASSFSYPVICFDDANYEGGEWCGDYEER